MLLSIIIPTYNRSNELIKNLSSLIKYISELDEWEEIEIICGDNNSLKEHKDKIKNYLNNYKNRVNIFFHSSNIGYENNLLFLLKKSIGEYVMLLGDDDYISFDYLQLVLSYLRTNKFGAIIPNCYSINEVGEKINRERDEINNDKFLRKVKDIRFIVKAHQLSGLVFRKEGVYDNYKKNVKSNLYPQIYFIGYSLMKEDGVHITRYPVRNTVIKKKNFSYQNDHLFGEIAKSVDPIQLNTSQKKSLIEYVINYNFERIYNRYTMLHPIWFANEVINKYDISILFKILIIRGYIKSSPIFIKQFFKKIIKINP